MNLAFRPALTCDASALSALIYRAKAHWQYPQAWLEAWADELKVSANYIQQHHVQILEVGEDIVGFFSLEYHRKQTSAQLEHLWIEPSYIGQGFGGKLLTLACQQAKSDGYNSIELIADPNAEGFYRRLGATKIAEINTKVLAVDRVLPKMQLILQSPNDLHQ